MKVSLNIIKQFINFELPPVDKLVARINAQLGGVDISWIVGLAVPGILYYWLARDSARALSPEQRSNA